MTARRWLSALWERVSTSIWLIPSAAIALALALGLVLVGVTVPQDLPFAGMIFGGTPEGARSLLSTVAGSTITVVGLTFSLTVVALQLAARQFSPRLLRTFLGDRGNQAVLSILLGTFVYTLTVLRRIRRGTEQVEAFVPQVAVSVALLLTLLSVAALIYFFHHLSQQLRIESVLRRVERDVTDLVRRFPRLGDGPDTPLALPRPPAAATPVSASSSGYLQMVAVEPLCRRAERKGLVLRIRPSLGSHVSEGTTIGWVWRVDGNELEDAGPASSLLLRSVTIGFERTLQQDIAFGLQQVVDIITRSLSAGINDPASAVNGIGSLAALLCDISGRRLGTFGREDDEGRVRVAVPAPSFADLLALACEEPLRYGREEPNVVAALLRLLTDVAEVAPTRERREDVRGQLEFLRPAAEDAGLEELVEECEWTLQAGSRLPSAPSRLPSAPSP